MLVHVPPPRITYRSGGSITLSRKIASAIAKDALAAAKELADQVPDAPDVTGTLDQLHALLDTVEDGLAGLNAILLQLRAALETLQGGEALPLAERSALVEAALTATALADAVRSIEPDAALHELQDTREAIAATIAALEEEERITAGRRSRLDTLCRQAVGTALCKATPQQASLLLRYPPPDHWQLTGVPPDEIPAKAREYAIADRDEERARRAKQKSASTATVTKAIADLWENAHAN